MLLNQNSNVFCLLLDVLKHVQFDNCWNTLRLQSTEGRGLQWNAL